MCESTMTTVEFHIDEFPDGRLMLLIVFREGKNFRINRKNGETYYTWCPYEHDLKFANRLYDTFNNDNKKFKKTESERRASEKAQTSKKGSYQKPFYT
jgi:hypothetical protein